jgi:hypothetical protein
MQKNMAWYAENFNVSKSRFFDEKTIKNEKKIKKKSKNEQKYFFRKNLMHVLSLKLKSVECVEFF